MSNNNSTKFSSLVTMSVVTCLLIDSVKTTIRSGAVTLKPARILPRLTSLENSDLRLNTVGPKFVDDVVQMSYRVHGGLCLTQVWQFRGE